MPVNLKAKLAYGTFRKTYKNDEKIKENMLLVESIDAASKEAALSATQEAADDPHILSREENDNIALNVMGHNNRGRFPLAGVGAVRGRHTISSTASTSTSTATGSSSRSPAMAAILRVSTFLRGKIDPLLLVQVTKDMFSDLPAAPTMDEVLTHIILCLSDKIPPELFGDIVSLLYLETGDTGSGQTGAQAGVAGGSSSGVQRRDVDDDDS